MDTREVAHEPLLRAAGQASLDPTTLSAPTQFRAIVLDADALDTARVARRSAAEALHDWGLSGLLDDVALCVSELVGNAVHHATPDGWQRMLGGPRRITVAFRAWPKWFFIEVCDEDSTPPMLPIGDLLDPAVFGTAPGSALPDHGRGLFIVQSLADATWWAPRDTGDKSVFCRFDTNGEADR
ncbi:ATP-binding protein [Streptomyces zingiberis]|uniref:ATP-binding protein n=1 Tax=Streptomyces zingiberis TaxID=2053010 RepID=A0ABX1BU02_9ACTN|nr:ATP-binding protein [Streptomyces zingiberis]NJQ00563.1 ATP-binding protein [Streptomyces zingiberis]